MHGLLPKILQNCIFIKKADMGLEALPVAGYSVLQNGLKRRFFSQNNEIDFLSNFIPGVQQVYINDPSKIGVSTSLSELG